MEIQLFNSTQFGAIRTAGNSERPLFCLADICKALDIGNPSQVKARLSPKDVQLIDLHALNSNEGIVGNSLASFVTESGLYKVIFQSRKPEAEAFTEWVTDVVLPAIRKTGGYIPTSANDTPEELMAKALLVANKTMELQKQRLQALAEENKKQQALLEEQKPKVLFADAVATAKQSCLIGELAKVLKQNGIDIGQNRLFEWLRNHGYLGKQNEYKNLPTQKAMELGLFEIKKNNVNLPDGVILVKSTTKVTGKGQQYFINKFLGGN